MHLFAFRASQEEKPHPVRDLRDSYLDDLQQRRQRRHDRLEVSFPPRPQRRPQR